MGTETDNRWDIPIFEALEPRLLLSGTPANLESHLIALLQQTQMSPVEAASSSIDQVESSQTSAIPNLLSFDADGRVYVDVWTRISPSNIVEGLVDLGFDILHLSEEYHALEGVLPVGSLVQAASLPGVLSVTPIYKPISRVGSVTSQGDSVHNANDVRDPAQFPPDGYDGTGVKVGVLSDSALDLWRSRATGDLPEYVEHLLNIPGAEEGRAMLEIVHDLATGAELSFRSVVLGELDFAQGIRDMAAAGAKVIVDDMILSEEPFFQDGIIAQAVNEVVDQYDVFYVAAAGNEGDLSYESSFYDDGSGWHDFDPGETVDSRQTITVPAVSEGYYFPMRAVLQWDQPFYTTDGVVSDFDIFVYDAGGTNIVASSTTDNIATQQPLEVLSWDADETDYTVAIQHKSGPTDVLLKYVLIGPDDLIIDEYATHSPTVIGHPAAVGAVAVGAVPWDAPDTIESFSSIGPSTIYFDPEGNRLSTPEVRAKPDLAAADGVTTSLGDFTPFYGTSAAAPHVAGIAAQIWSSNPHLTRNELYQVLTSTAVDLGDVGPDNVYGHGRIDALAAQPLAAAVADVTSPQVRSISPDGIASWHVDHLSIWFTEPLAADTATNTANYDLREAGADETFNTTDDVVFTVNPVWTPADYAVTLTIATVPQTLGFGVYQLTLLSGGGADPSGNALEGGDYVHTFEIASEPPEVLLTGDGLDGKFRIRNDRIAWAVRDDGAAFRAVAYSPSYGIYGQPQVLITAYDSNGYQLGPAWAVPTEQWDSSRVEHIDMAMDASGGCLVWSDNEINVRVIRLQLLDTLGRPIGESLNVGSMRLGYAYSKVAMTADRIAVAYLASFNEPVTGRLQARIEVSLFDRAGNRICEAFPVRESGFFDRSYGTFSLDMDAEGNVLVVWDRMYEIYDGNSEHTEGLFCKGFDRNGDPVSDVVNLAPNLTLSKPSVAATADGSFVIGWRDSTRSGVYSGRYNINGQALGKTELVFPKVSSPEVEANSAGGYTVASVWWDADGTGVYMRAFGDDGAPVTPILRMNTDEVGSQIDPLLALRSDYGGIYCWEEDGEYIAKWFRWDSDLSVASKGPFVTSYQGHLAGDQLTGVSVTFDRAILAASFQAEDVAVRNPAGQLLPLRTVDPIIPDGDLRTFTIHLQSPSEIPGHYSVTLGPEIEDTEGRLMNQDGSIINGEGTDAFTCQLAIIDICQRQLFYNNSYLDGNNASADVSDDNAINTNKEALRLPGTPSPANYTGYSRGINGIMIDIAGLAGTPTTDDFVFNVSNDDDPVGWRELELHEQPGITVRPVDGVDRITLIWPDGAIRNQWIEITVKAAGNIGIEADDVFYFCSAVADTNGDGKVNISDYRTFTGEFGGFGGIGELDSDFNADGRVDLNDFAIVRSSFGNEVATPSFLSAVPEAPLAAPVPVLQAVVEPTVAVAAPAPVVAVVVSQAIEDRERLTASDNSDPDVHRDTPNYGLAPVVDLLVDSLSAGGYVSESQAVSGGGGQLAATSAYDLRPLGDNTDDLEFDGGTAGGELLADVLAESALGVPL